MKLIISDEIIVQLPELAVKYPHTISLSAKIFDETKDFRCNEWPELALKYPQTISLSTKIFDETKTFRCDNCAALIGTEIFTD